VRARAGLPERGGRVSATLDAATLAELARVAADAGLLRLGIVRLDHAGFAASRDALDRYLADGREGEMEFVRRSADVRKDPSLMLEGARSMLVAIVPYRSEPTNDGATIARYARASDYHTVVHERLEVLEAALAKLVPEARVLICVDTKPVFERAAAALAGLGFIGKHGCVIVPGLGSWFVLGAMLTTAQWRGPDAIGEDEAPLASTRWQACGSCTRCLDACPTDAFIGPGELDPRRCISYLTIEHRGAIDEPLATEIGARMFGCDVCQEVCPYNAAPDREARIPDAAWLPAPKGPFRSTDPWKLVDIGSATYRAWAKHTPVRRVPRRSMRRNALLVLGNETSALTSDERDRVAALAGDPEPQIAAASRRLLRRRL
jgi:epoxyqueuosine reductase